MLLFLLKLDDHEILNEYVRTCVRTLKIEMARQVKELYQVQSPHQTQTKHTKTIMCMYVNGMLVNELNTDLY